MASITCPACAAQISDQAEACPQCGKPVKSPATRETTLIQKPGGKLQAVGTVLLAAAVIATVLGAWWGPALLFPAVIVFFLGRIW
jgi:predicted amidophosphoribosyltransferase